MKMQLLKRTTFLFLLLIIGTSLFLSCSKSASTQPTSNNYNNPTNSSGATLVSIYNMAFDAKSITVKVGTTIKWTNNDGVAHTVTSNDGTSFDSGTIGAGGSFSFTFTHVGTFDYHCTLHSSMTGKVVVTN